MLIYTRGKLWRRNIKVKRTKSGIPGDQGLGLCILTAQGPGSLLGQRTASSAAW